jgi:hypothetical protein
MPTVPQKNPYTMQDYELAKRICQECAVWGDMLDRHEAMGIDVSNDRQMQSQALHYATELRKQYFPDLP